MKPPLEPLDPRLQELFADERDAPGLSPEARARVLDRLHATIAGPGGSGPEPGGQGGPPVIPSAAGAGSRLMAQLLSPVTWVALAVGAGGGAGLHATLARPPAPEVRVVTRTVEVPAREAPAREAPARDAPAPPPASPPALPPAPPAPAPSAPPRASSGPAEPMSRDRQLAQETALITRAQSALARGNTAAALLALGEHARRFPRGQLNEEREALRAQAMAAARPAGHDAP